MVRKRRSRPVSSIERITIIPLGSVDGPVIDFLSSRLPEVLGKKVEIGSPIEDFGYAYNERRRQYLAEAILLKLAQMRDSIRGRILGATGVGLYRQDGHGTFGHASREQKVAVLSIHHLRDEHYGLPRNREKLQERGLKEAIHQIGHTYGLGGCKNPL